MAAWAASLIGCGTSKSGWPMLRFTGSFRLRASSNTLRMPDDSMCAMRPAIQRSAADFCDMHHLPNANFSSPFHRFELVVRRRDEFIDEVVERPLDFADPFGPLLGVVGQAPVNEVAQGRRRGGCEFLHRLEHPRERLR